ncbi:MAG: hypothetical protein HC853_14845 [Anaerolineae bacterium]|nr:hypothetical protein [Anaerolineae bacterium]
MKFTCSFIPLKAALSIIALVGLGMSPLQPSRAQLPPRPTPGLPPRPPAPAPVLPPAPQASGGHIVLRLPHAHTDWTEVVWEDATGGLHLVEGWRAYAAQGEVRWFVAPYDFRKGPFRWQVYDKPNGRLLATSERFLVACVSCGHHLHRHRECISQHGQ